MQPCGGGPQRSHSLGPHICFLLVSCSLPGELHICSPKGREPSPTPFLYQDQAPECTWIPSLPKLGDSLRALHHLEEIPSQQGLPRQWDTSDSQHFCPSSAFGWAPR